MTKKFFSLACIACCFQVITAQPVFVSVKGNQFSLHGQPFYFIGTNYWYGGLLALKKDQKRGIERLREELDFLKKNGVTNVRVLAGSEGKGLINGVNRVGPPLQPSEGNFDPRFLKGMDALLYELGKRKMTAVIYLSNNWNWSGGFLQYLHWNGLISDSSFLGNIPWTETGKYTSMFYDCEKCMQEYLNQVKYVITRTNSINHKKYSEELAIMAWELANEPRPMRFSAIDAYKRFLSSSAAFIKKLDPNHLITTGTEGYMSTDNLALYKEIHSDKNIDYLTIHIWPKNWSWFSGNDIAAGMDSVLNETKTYLDVHKKVAMELNKPLVIEEFGLPRDHHSYDIDSPTTLRNIYYREILSEWLKSKRNNGVLAGVNFWAYGGTAKPVKGQLMWKEGNEYMGDPPMEEQGLNTVFNSDKSTWKLIDSFSLTPNGSPKMPVERKKAKEPLTK